jgi:phage terminase large subunit GpA-like protein
MMAVDSGFNTQTVYGWCAKASDEPRHRGARRADGARADRIAVEVDVTVSGRKLKRGYKVWPIATNLAKSELYGWLALQRRPTRRAPPARSRRPGSATSLNTARNSSAADGRAARAAQRSPKGFTMFAWELIPGRENHQLDARVYARAAAAAVVGLDRFKESDWSTLEQRLGVVAAAAGTVRNTDAAPGRRTPPRPPSRQHDSDGMAVWSIGSRPGRMAEGPTTERSDMAWTQADVDTLKRDRERCAVRHVQRPVGDVQQPRRTAEAARGDAARGQRGLAGTPTTRYGRDE